LEVTTLLALRRAVRNGSVWIEHSLSFRGRERLFLPEERWQAEARRHYARLQLPAKASEFLVPLLARVLVGVDAVAAAARSGDLRVDDELHLVSLAAEGRNTRFNRGGRITLGKCSSGGNSIERSASRKPRLPGMMKSTQWGASASVPNAL
jgi:hypothetical protein